MKKMLAITLALVVVLAIVTWPDADAPLPAMPQATTASAHETEAPMYVIDTENLHDIYFAGGCFWGVEEYFRQIPGVYDVTVGYANGTGDNPTYEQVCFGNTGYAETAHVQYDPSVVSLTTLTQQFFKIINPLSVNKQGNDRGVQYRTGVYYVDDEDLDAIQAVFDQVEAAYGKPLATELVPLDNFWLAEEYHQDYLQKNPGGYCHITFETLDEVEVEEGARLADE